MLHKLMSAYNANMLNGYSENVSMLSLEKQNTDALEGMHCMYFCVFDMLNVSFDISVDCDLLAEDNHLVPNPEDMCVVAIGSGSGDQSEDSSITDSER